MKALRSRNSIQNLIFALTISIKSGYGYLTSLPAVLFTYFDLKISSFSMEKNIVTCFTIAITRSSERARA